jgi:hypothetical protein
MIGLSHSLGRAADLILDLACRLNGSPSGPAQARASVAETTGTELERPLDYRKTVDDALDAYLEWRNECAAARGAYHSWALSPPIDATLAFGAYQAALDREESAAVLGRGRRVHGERRLFRDGPL